MLGIWASLQRSRPEVLFGESDRSDMTFLVEALWLSENLGPCSRGARSNNRNSSVRGPKLLQTSYHNLRQVLRVSASFTFMAPDEAWLQGGNGRTDKSREPMGCLGDQGRTYVCMCIYIYNINYTEITSLYVYIYIYTYATCM